MSTLTVEHSATDCGRCGGAILLPLMSRLTHAAPTATPRFVFIGRQLPFEPVTVLTRRR